MHCSCKSFLLPLFSIPTKRFTFTLFFLISFFKTLNWILFTWLNLFNFIISYSMHLLILIPFLLWALQLQRLPNHLRRTSIGYLKLRKIKVFPLLFLLLLYWFLRNFLQNILNLCGGIILNIVFLTAQNCLGCWIHFFRLFTLFIFLLLIFSDLIFGITIEIWFLLQILDCVGLFIESVLLLKCLALLLCS